MVKMFGHDCLDRVGNSRQHETFISGRRCTFHISVLLAIQWTQLETETRANYLVNKDIYPVNNDGNFAHIHVTHVTSANE